MRQEVKSDLITVWLASLLDREPSAIAHFSVSFEELPYRQLESGQHGTASQGLLGLEVLCRAVREQHMHLSSGGLNH